ncbi:uncharacterized protein LOC120277673 isoform X2 [Dioscorea cayenensis subsp. rotundata]|uniref:Uncharacterized protein LOC120277673 isoform X2 n=1 Tax=Dioscorea cayennensis subsp. rotundata TaxID=55577 RepID=A0AB40CPK0_DIOCR|nr:uncharacterized protein LOC120277673 isoform X2 [Dioscorea cayenensis subsp. rotundata]XP_039140481.1 uncharacterized protein LOC120277673 isoform X2 [Dioscorea cayenensis subsp. rotundata]XP_039140487.1 uncharacterized protein LOC120277673 isoform X2 [Dioscorea cayenensis subsp. rotundata]
MTTEPAIVDISSDEEDFDSFDGACKSNYDFISKILGCVDHVVARQSDDLIVLDEFSSAPVIKERNSSSARLADPPTGGSDDDCLVLESDPHKLVSVTNEKADGDESEELLVVGETGQVACRDYPHSRHLCARFPFSITSHESHCSLCHCYVCDSPAPCEYWGNGLLSSDHCHSTDKEARWIDERKSFKLRSTQNQNSQSQGTHKQNPQSQSNPGLSKVVHPQSMQSTRSSNSIPRRSYGNLAPRRNQHNSLLRSIPYSNSPLQACSTTSIAMSTPLSETNQGLRTVTVPFSQPTTMWQMAPIQREKRSATPPIMQAYSRSKKSRTAGNDSLGIACSLQQQSSVAICGSTCIAANEKTKFAATVSGKDDSMLYWREILAKVASQLEVSVSDTEISTTNGQPQDGSSHPSDFANNLLLPQQNAMQNITDSCQHAAPENITLTVEPSSLGIGCSYSFGEFVCDSDPVTVKEPSPPPNNVSAPGKPHLGNVFAALDDITPDPAVDIDPLSLFNAGDIAWDCLGEL